MSNDIAIKVERVSKSFKLPHNRQNSLKGTLINLISRGDRTFETQDVLKDVSFEIEKGEFFGIVGRNGSGKSTLLKMLAGIYTPTKGSITVNGSLTPFIELGVGFNPELTGRENVYMNGALLGFNNKEMDAMYDDIVSFAELERFMDQKLKNYSSGMQVRLAFSIAIRAKSDILVLDEVLAVGDAAFQRKCNKYFEEQKQKKQTIVLVTHDMESVKKFCTRAMFIEGGTITAIGSPDEVASQYTLTNLDVHSKNEAGVGLSERLGGLRITPRSKSIVTSHDTYEFDIEYTMEDDAEVYIGISVLSKDVSVIEDATFDICTTSKKGVPQTFRYALSLDRFFPGQFKVTAAVFYASTRELIGFTNDNTSAYFIISEPGILGGGLLRKRGEWIRLPHAK